MALLNGPSVPINGERLLQRITELAEIGKIEGTNGCSRFAFSDADREALTKRIQFGGDDKGSEMSLLVRISAENFSDISEKLNSESKFRYLIFDKFE